MLNAGSPDPAAKSSTTESGEIDAAESSASVIALFHKTAHFAHRSLTRACAARSHVSRSVIAFKQLHSIVEISITGLIVEETSEMLGLLQVLEEK